ncbi:MAG: repeat domain protein [Labilithrix sp.]|nr:repeat domain protein [Labilithrix sp.]
MRVRVKLAAIGTALPAVALLAHGCKNPTQVTLDIGTNVVCSDMRGVEIVVASDTHEAEHRAALDVEGRRFPTATTSDCTEGTVPRKIGTLVVTPGNSDGSVVVIAAFGKTRVEDCVAPRFAPECIVARRRFGFVDHQSVTLPIVLDPICAGVPCNENSTCVGKKCVDSFVDCASGTCAPPGRIGPDGGPLEVDGASPLDAAPLDGDTIADGSSGEGGDGSTVTDGATEASTDAGVAGACPMTPTCQGSPGAVCASVVGQPPPGCCYPAAAGSGTCTEQSACTKGVWACCRDSDDCNTGQICCASTQNAAATTRMTCRVRTECVAAGGAVVCKVPGNAGCGAPGTSSCIGAEYSTAPQYFRCS